MKPPSLQPRHYAATALTVVLLGSAAVALPTAARAADTSPPTQPGASTVSNVTTTSAGLAWVRSSDNVGIEGYRVYRGPAGGGTQSLSLIATTDGVTSYPATKLYSGTAYTFGITAIDAADNQSSMRTTTVTTGSSSDSTAPAAPSSSSVSGKAFSSSRIDLVWGASTSSDVAGYQVLRNGSLIATIDLPNATRYSDNGLAASTSYSYVVKAVDSARNVSAGTTARNVSTLAAGTSRIARGPYVSNVTAGSAVISWWTNIPTKGVVSYGVSSVTDHKLTDSSTTQHHAVSLTHLSADSVYKYQVGDGGALVTAATFATAASPGHTFSFATIGDFGGGSTGETQNANNIAGSSAAFIQTLGDNIYPTAGNPDPDFGTVYSDFDGRFFKQFGTAVKTRAFFPANGNKEYYGDGAFWNCFPMPGSNHSWYSYDWGNAHIVVLDGEQPMSSGSAQYTFLQNDLAGHQSATWRIVAIQRPPYSSTSAKSSSQPVQQYLVPLFQQYDVALVLSGNSHNYERSYPLVGGVPTTGGVTYVVTGGGGNGFNAFTIAQPAWSAFREASYYEYTRVTVSSASIVVEGIRADTNAVFDSVTITP